MIKYKSNCRCCKTDSGNILMTGQIFDATINYFDCLACGYVQTETPYWLEQAYSAAINESDTGIMARNQANARITLLTLMILGELDGRVVDCAGGYGIFVRLLRDYGINTLWSDRFCQNLLARGFEHQGESAALVTAFEAFEHFVNPNEELDRLLEISTNVLFSTELINNVAPKQSDWWYYGAEHGQHIGFFRLKTLQKMATERGKYLISNGKSHHLITNKPINQYLWRAMLKMNALFPPLLRYRLKSKIWDDHYQAVKK